MMRPRNRTRLWRTALLLSAFALLLLLARDARQLWRAWQFNRAIDLGATVVGARDASPEVLFVQAHAAARAGHAQEALALYQSSARHERLAAAADYNSGNVHLREALQLARDNLLGQRPQAVELAKQRYRDALRADPGHWPTRYNLERALRLAPEVDEDTSAPAPRGPAERAVTTMRGFTLGLP